MQACRQLALNFGHERFLSHFDVFYAFDGLLQCIVQLFDRVVLPLDLLSRQIARRRRSSRIIEHFLHATLHVVFNHRPDAGLIALDLVRQHFAILGLLCLGNAQCFYLVGGMLYCDLQPFDGVLLAISFRAHQLARRRCNSRTRCIEHLLHATLHFVLDFFSHT